MKNTAYEEALIKIWKTGGKVWADNRWCSDSSYLAGKILKKVNPKLHLKLDDLAYTKIKVFKNGKIKIVK